MAPLACPQFAIRFGNCLASPGWAGRGTRPYVAYSGLQFRQFFPEEFAAIQHTSSAHVKQIYRQHLVFVVIAEYIGVIPFYGCNALFFLKLLNCLDKVAVLGRALVLLRLSGSFHATPRRAWRIRRAAFEE